MAFGYSVAGSSQASRRDLSLDHRARDDLHHHRGRILYGYIREHGANRAPPTATSGSGISGNDIEFFSSLTLT